MKKKFLSFILAVLMILPGSFILTACSPNGKTDTNLYHLSFMSSFDITFDITLNAGQKAQLKAELKGERENTEELLNAGATQEKLNKAGVRQSNGSYYFFSQDPLYLYAPEVEGYTFLGFYVNGQDIHYKYYDHELPIDGKPDDCWIMPENDVTLLARYEELSYVVAYDSEVLRYGVGIDNPAEKVSYDASRGDRELYKPNEPEGLRFKCWYYEEPDYDGTSNPPVKKVICTKLPRIGKEGIFHNTYIKGVAYKELTLFAEYEEI